MQRRTVGELDVHAQIPAVDAGDFRQLDLASQRIEFCRTLQFAHGIERHVAGDDDRGDRKRLADQALV